METNKNDTNRQFREALTHIKADRRLTIKQLSDLGVCSSRHIQGILSPKESKGVSLSVGQHIAKGLGMTYQDMLSLGRYIIEKGSAEGWTKPASGHAAMALPPLESQGCMSKVTESTISEDIKISDMLRETTIIMESDLIYKDALVLNIRALGKSVRREKKMKELEKKIDMLLEKMERMEKLIGKEHGRKSKKRDTQANI